jgi:TolB protein
MTALKTFRPGRWLSLVLTSLFLASGLVGCGPRTTDPKVSSTSLASSVTPIPTLSAEEQKDVVILSIEENGYSHLFGFTPGTSSLLRLTSGEWSDEDPALSPDGKLIAFASNRGGHWDIYTLEVASGKISQLTHTSEYDSSPTWSPDMAWIAYESYRSGSLNIDLLSLNNAGQKPVMLTDGPSTNSSPAWAPNGREIAFLSNRTGNSDIWIADLNKTQDRFSNLSNSSQTAESHPIWSPDGGHLAWASSSLTSAFSGIYVWDAAKPDKAPLWVGDGDWPAWNARGDEMVTVVNGQNQTLLTAYNLQNQLLILPLPLPGHVNGLIWPKLTLPNPLPATYLQAAALTPPVLWVPQDTPLAGVPANRQYVVPLSGVQAPYPKLQNLVKDSFDALRQRVIKESGWDALASLQNAYVPLTTALDPGLGEDWLYTGRAFAINSLMVNAGWMVVGREDIGAQTYWRLYLRAQVQDGSRGAPLENPPWDLNARYELDPITYEAGGQYATVPPGYWIDFTSLAAAYGWQRLPSLPNWRNYYAGARLSEFVMTGGLDWNSAMLELYPPQALYTATPVLPPSSTPTITPIPSSTPAPTRTLLNTLTPSLSPTPAPPTMTPLPSSTPLPTSTPPTIIPTFKP